ncbi:MAG: hypothetical protein EON95_03955 [Caulobacteraceae bacterium]|nr:MAG: hypothetical protein EON95_03955 [Caulobacteraceae bacterium]
MKPRRTGIRTREHLIHLLTEAAEVEHDLLCAYLYATFSLKRAGEPGLTAEQGEAVERWRKVILTVALEEMAHLASVNNLLIAIGGAPHFDRPNLPASPGYVSASVVVRLTPFNKASLDHFIFLERADAVDVPVADGFEPEAPAREAPRDRITPSAEDYGTIGELYDSLADGFSEVTAMIGEGVLIDPAGAGQLDSEILKLPNVRRITDLASALAVIEHIKEEGEGSGGAREASHFDRFVSIRDEWADLVSRAPDFEPAWPAAHDPVMRGPANGLERVWITAEPAASLLDLGNALYGTMLQLLDQTFTCADPDDRSALMLASVEVMEACAAVATALARLPASPDHPGVNAGITFAVPRNLGYRPNPTRTRTVFTERLGALASRARDILTGETAQKAERRLGNALKLLGNESPNLDP